MEGDMLRDRVAIVTGGARGIGAAIAELVARHGAAVVIGDINGLSAEQRAQTLREQGLAVIGVEADVTTALGREALVQAAQHQFGGVDMLVNNAGIISQTKLEDITEAGWDRLMDVNLKSAFFCAQLVIPIMRERAFGRIINISSVVARSGGLASPAHYVVSKAGILGLTKSLARIVAPFNITANSICPGFIDSDMTAIWTEETRNRLIGLVPLGRLGTPHDVAGAALFLCSPYADYLTGITIDVNGGSDMP